MLRSIKELCHYTVEAAEGTIGKIEDCLFDDRSWTVRYLVINSESGLPQPRVLLKTDVFEQPDWECKVVKVALTKGQISHSPQVDADETIAREPHLHSTRHVLDFRIQARDGEIGRLVDFITDDETWSIYYLVGDTQERMSQKQILVAPEWLKTVNWAESEIHVDLLCETLKNSIEYDPAALIDREYEEQLQDPLRVVLKAIWASKRPKLPA